MDITKLYRNFFHDPRIIEYIFCKKIGEVCFINLSSVNKNIPAELGDFWHGVQ